MTSVVLWVTLATVIVGFVTAIIGVRHGNDKLKEIHVLVNSRLTSVVNRVAQLIIVLKAHGIEIPDDPDEKERNDPNVGLYLLAVVSHYRLAIRSDTGAIRCVYQRG
jgi:hypothetical protein